MKKVEMSFISFDAQDVITTSGTEILDLTGSFAGNLPIGDRGTLDDMIAHGWAYPNGNDTYYFESSNGTGNTFYNINKITKKSHSGNDGVTYIFDLTGSDTASGATISNILAFLQSSGQ